LLLFVEQHGKAWRDGVARAQHVDANAAPL
jgi:hypothetical protein